MPTKITDWLLACKRKRVTLDELQQASMPMSYADFRQLLEKLQSDDILTPIKAASTDHSGLARKYTLHRGPLLAPTAQKIAQEALATGLSGEINLSWYQQQPYAIWQRDQQAIAQLSRYLQKHTDTITPASLQQRSYDIFGDEKYLLQAADFLTHLGLTPARLGIVPESDPLMFATRPFTGQDTLYHHLIVENKAPWQAMLPHLPATPFTTLILGYGWKICAGLAQLPQQCGLPDARHCIWYFGDLDWEGLRIFTTLQEQSPLPVRLAVPFYTAFWQHPAAHGKTNQQPAPECLESLRPQLPAELLARIAALLKNGQYYPQEALTPAELLACAKETIHGTGEF